MCSAVNANIVMTNDHVHCGGRHRQQRPLDVEKQKQSMSGRNGVEICQQSVSSTDDRTVTVAETANSRGADMSTDDRYTYQR